MVQNNVVGRREIQTQKRLINLFQDELNYTYLGEYHYREKNSNIEETLLEKYLKKNNYSDEKIKKVLFKISHFKSQDANLYNLNKDFYENYLISGVNIEQLGENSETIEIIDFENPKNNDFYIAEEVTIKGEFDKRPDLVLYVNGIALGVIELKRSTRNVFEGITQNRDNQNAMFIRYFFNTIQFVIAANDSQGLRYGTTGTKAKYFLYWKEDEDTNYQYNNFKEQLDREILQICSKERFLDLIKNFIVFDGGIKKLCRPNQYFGVKASQEHIKKKQGGVIWHTQGSGKSLTMVWLAKWIKRNVANARIFLITDRTELDEQIEKVFRNVGESPYRTKSGKDLIDKLNSHQETIVTSLIHKFGKKTDDNERYDKYLDEIKKNLPKDFSPKGEIFLFVDECHRTQAGKLNKALNELLPNSVKIGFTGTPLLKQKEGKITKEVFGGSIHTYKFNEAVKDGVVLDLLYESRDVDQFITSKNKIDDFFERKTIGLSEKGIAELKRRWGKMQKLFSSAKRLEKIVFDIETDFDKLPRLSSGQGNAMLVAGSIYEAYRYYEYFQQMGFEGCAVVTSYNGDISEVKGEEQGECTKSEKQFIFDTHNKMLEKYKKEYPEIIKPEDFEKVIKEHFIKNPAQMKLLIVVSKLLTGFDAPSTTYLYIDKSMRDHDLFQAICRVNRLDGEEKDYGYIIDYKDLFGSIEKAFEDYTNSTEMGDNPDPSDLLKSKVQVSKEKFEFALQSLTSIDNEIKDPKDDEDYKEYFIPRNLNDLDVVKTKSQERDEFYKLVRTLNRAYVNITQNITEAGYTIEDIEKFEKERAYYLHKEDVVKLSSGDTVNYKEYDPQMRRMLDMYVNSNDTEVMVKFEESSILDLVSASGIDKTVEDLKKVLKNERNVSEAIENNIRKVIIDKNPFDSKYYQNMSLLLDELIKQRLEKVVNYKDYLLKLEELAKKVKTGKETETKYPNSINTLGKKLIFEELDNDEELTIKIYNDLKLNGPEGWVGDKQKTKKIKKILQNYLESNETINKFISIIGHEEEFIK